MPNGGGSEKGFSQVPDIENQESAVVELANRDGGDVGLRSSGEGLGYGGVVPVTVVVCDDGGTRVGDEAVVKGSVDSSQEACLKSPKKKHLPRIDSFGECRICQQEKEEILIELGCQCRGGLAKAHRSCIDAWFRTRGSNKCEICQEVAANVPPPLSHLRANYWVWRVDPAFRGSVIAQERERGCFSPLWVAFSILIGGLLLDVLISVTLGVSALPVNIIIGVIVVLGLGTALRLALDFCHEWSLRRAAQRIEMNENPGYHPAL